MCFASRPPLAPLAILATFCFGEARADLINFDFDANGNPITGPIVFSATSPLTELYAPLGVHFSGPTAGSGGAIINPRNGFGVPPRSGTNIFGFNRRATYPGGGAPTDPESILFDALASSVSIWASGGFAAGTFRIDAYDSSNTLVGSSTAKNAIGSYALLAVSYAGGIRRVELRSLNAYGFAFDDLEFAPLSAATPEPGSLALASLGGLALFGARRLRSRRRQPEQRSSLDEERRVRRPGITPG